MSNTRNGSGGEEEVWLNPHDIDHLRDGQPVYKDMNGTLLTLRAASWDELKAMGGTDE